MTETTETGGAIICTNITILSPRRRFPSKASQVFYVRAMLRGAGRDCCVSVDGIGPVYGTADGLVDVRYEPPGRLDQAAFGCEVAVANGATTYKP